MFDEHAIAFARIAPRERVREGLNVVARFLPDLPREVVASHVQVWQDDRWQKGAFAFAKPNQLKWIWSAARKPEGRVHFAPWRLRKVNAQVLTPGKPRLGMYLDRLALRADPGMDHDRLAM
jgi:hypothetical protein